MPAESLTILSYNVYNHHEGSAAFEHRARAIMNVIAEAGADLVCVQEAPSPEFLRWLAAELTQRQRRHMRVACTEMRRPDGWTEHLGIVHPGTMRVASVHAAPTGEHIAISIQVPRPALTIVSAHLNPHSAETREAQARQLLAELRAAGPLVVCGDFNASRDDLAMIVLTTELEPLAPAPGVARTFPTALRSDLPGGGGGVVDHILGRGVVVEASGIVGDAPADGMWASDHVAVWARLGLRP